MKSTFRFLASATLVLAILPVGSAQDTKKAKHDTNALYRSLGDVINTGAKLYNDQADYAGCYRVFQGSLVAVRPFLTPDLQKRIDTGLASAEKKRTPADRAWELRHTLDDVRKQLQPAGLKSEEKKTPATKVDKKTPEPKKTPKSEKLPAVKGDGKGQVAGKLTLQSKAIGGGYYVTLVKGDKRFSSTVQKDGTFKFATSIPPGEYRVAIEPIKDAAIQRVAIPPRYGADATSGLMIRVQAGKQTVELNLVK